MPVYSKSLMKLTAYLAAAASVEYPIEVSTIATHTGISGSNIRLLLNQHSDMFHFTRVGNVNCYFLVPNEKARRILTAAARVNGEVHELAYPEGGISKINQVLASNPTPVAEPSIRAEVKQYVDVGLETTVTAILAAWNNGRAPHQLTDIEALTKTRNMCEAIALMIGDRIKELI